MSKEEVDAIRKTGMLRGGRPEETYWTEDYYESAQEAQVRLALRRRPEKRVWFRIINEPVLERDNLLVAPHEGQPGGGTEYQTRADEKVEVEVIEVADLK
jgi:hypothetical protein